MWGDGGYDHSIDSVLVYETVNSFPYQETTGWRSRMNRKGCSRPHENSLERLIVTRVMSKELFRQETSFI